MVAENSDIDAVIEAVTYAFRRLPLSVQTGWCSPKNANSRERLLVYMAQYMAWARDSFQKHDEFYNLLESCHDFAVALVVNSRAASVPPWSETDSTSKKETSTVTVSKPKNPLAQRK